MHIYLTFGRKIKIDYNTISTKFDEKEVPSELVRASEGTLSRLFRLHLQTLAPTNPHWARMVGYGLFLWLIHKESLCPSSGGINRLMMMIKKVHTSNCSTNRLTLSQTLRLSEVTGAA
jgi:hypothetical protein